MSDISDAVDEIINMLEARFSSAEACNEKVLKSLMFATTNALLATKNEECEIVFDNYKSTFSVEPVE